jgi:ATP-dependent DNA helicase RecG
VEDQDVLNLARDAAEKVIVRDEKLEGLPLIRDELEYRYSKLMGGAILT